jgi:hypothetical protein
VVVTAAGLVVVVVVAAAGLVVVVVVAAAGLAVVVVVAAGLVVVVVAAGLAVVAMAAGLVRDLTGGLARSTALLPHQPQRSAPPSKKNEQGERNRPKSLKKAGNSSWRGRGARGPGPRSGSAARACQANPGAGAAQTQRRGGFGGAIVKAGGGFHLCVVRKARRGSCPKIAICATAKISVDRLVSWRRRHYRRQGVRRLI